MLHLVPIFKRKKVILVLLLYHHLLSISYVSCYAAFLLVWRAFLVIVGIFFLGLGWLFGPWTHYLCCLDAPNVFDDHIHGIASNCVGKVRHGPQFACNVVQCCSVVIVNVVQWASLIHVLFFFGWEEGASLDATEMFGNNAFILGGLYCPSPWLLKTSTLFKNEACGLIWKYNLVQCF